MPATESTIMEKLHVLELDQVVTKSDVKTLTHEKDLLWQAVDKIRDTVSGIRIQVAGIVGGIGIFQIIITAWIVYKITSGTKGG